MARVLVTRQLPFAALDRLAAAHDVDVWEHSEPPTPEQLRARIAGAEGLLCLLTERVDAAVLAAAPRLRAISVFAVGYDGMTVAHTEEHSLDEVLRRSDVVSLHVPLSDATRGLIGAEALAAMKPGAILVNTARGPIVDQVALAAALHDGRLGAAALEVTDPEPLTPEDRCCARPTSSCCPTWAAPRTRPARGWPRWPSTIS